VAGGGASGAEPILHHREGRVGYITINRPPLNILNIAAFHAFETALRKLDAAGEADIVVIRAAGERAFCAGADVSEHTPEMAPKMLEAFHRVARRLWASGVVSVAAARGLALGGGFELLLCCDIVVATDDVQLGQPEIKVGSFPPIAAALLPDSIGRQLASDLVLTGRRLSGFEALALGLVSRLVSPEELDAEIERVVQALADNSGAVMRRAVKALRGARSLKFAEALAVTEKIYLEDLLPHPDAREGVEAFLQKRKPKWSQRE